MMACGEHNEECRGLMLADSLAMVDPQRASALLDSLDGELADASEALKMRYRLVRIKTDDELGIMPQGDSAIAPLLEYYGTHNVPARLRAEAYYYGGRIYASLGDTPQSVSWFRKAADQFDSDSCSRLQWMIHNQCGSLYTQQRLYNEAVKEYRLAASFSRRLGDSGNIMSAYMYMANSFHSMRQIDSALYYFDRARVGAMILGDTVRIPQVEIQQSLLYIHHGSLPRARQRLRPYMTRPVPGYEDWRRLAVASYYRATGETDSAEAYYTLLINGGNLNMREIANREMGHIEMERKNPWKAMLYANRSTRLRDTIDQITQTQGVRQVNALYNYELREREAQRLKAEVGRVRGILLWAIGGMAVVGIMVLLYVKYMNLKRRQLKARLIAIEHIKDEQFKKSQEYINENLAKIRELESQIYDAGCENERLKVELEERRRDYELATQSATLAIDRRAAAESRLFNSPLYTRLRTTLDTADSPALSPDDWDMLARQVNETYSGFDSTLRGVMGLSEHEYRVCLLLKIGMSPIEIARILNRSKEAVSSTRRRLYERIFAKKGTGKDWDCFISTL